MNRLISLILGAVLFYFFLTATSKCGGEFQYPFNEPVETIVSVEIVDAQDWNHYTRVRVLSEDEMNGFLQVFCELKFRDYLPGELADVYKGAVKIVYQSGNYEILDHYASYYVIPSDSKLKRKYNGVFCDKDQFEYLVARYMETPAFTLRLSEPEETINSIEIGDASSGGSSFHSLYTIEKDQWGAFLQDFHTLSFRKVLVGYIDNLPSGREKAIRITYITENYELIGSSFVKYVDFEKLDDRWIVCDKKAFEEFIQKYLK